MGSKWASLIFIFTLIFITGCLLQRGVNKLKVGQMFAYASSYFEYIATLETNVLLTNPGGDDYIGVTSYVIQCNGTHLSDDCRVYQQKGFRHMSFVQSACSISLYNYGYVIVKCLATPGSFNNYCEIEWDIMWCPSSFYITPNTKCIH